MLVLYQPVGVLAFSIFVEMLQRYEVFVAPGIYGKVNATEHNLSCISKISLTVFLKASDS